MIDLYQVADNGNVLPLWAIDLSMMEILFLPLLRCSYCKHAPKSTLQMNSCYNAVLFAFLICSLY